MTEPDEPDAFDPPIGPDDDDLPDELPDLDDVEPFETDADAYDDTSEFVSAEWRAATTARERVRDIITRMTDPMSATEIATIADVSPPTARTTLGNLAEEGVVVGTSSADGTVYRRNPDWYRLRRVHTLADTPRETVESVLQRLDREIRGYRETYGVDSPEDLLVDEYDLDDDVWQDIDEWRTALVDRLYVKTALQFRRLRDAEARRSTVDRDRKRGNGDEHVPIDQ